MSRKFTIKVAGCRWAGSSTLQVLVVAPFCSVGLVKKEGRAYYATAFSCRGTGKFKTMSAAKAYVIKQLAGEGKESK